MLPLLVDLDVARRERRRLLARAQIDLHVVGRPGDPELGRPEVVEIALWGEDGLQESAGRPSQLDVVGEP
jgi:hypothetical protein